MHLIDNATTIQPTVSLPSSPSACLVNLNDIHYTSLRQSQQLLEEELQQSDVPSALSLEKIQSSLASSTRLAATHPTLNITPSSSASSFSGGANLNGGGSSRGGNTTKLPLSFEELGLYDDFLSHVMLDLLHLGFDTCKFSADYHERISGILPTSPPTSPLSDGAPASSSRRSSTTTSTTSMTRRDFSLLQKKILSLVQSFVFANIQSTSTASYSYFPSSTASYEKERSSVLIADTTVDAFLELFIQGAGADDYLAQAHIQLVMSREWPRQYNELRDHIKRYLGMYHPRAGFEITATSRYSDILAAKAAAATSDTAHVLDLDNPVKRKVTQLSEESSPCPPPPPPLKSNNTTTTAIASRRGGVEAKIIATRPWKRGDEIRHCTGVIASLRPEEEAALARDFSIMYSTKRKCHCLFLGPARFVNHDCQPNCQVIRDIAVGEELTTTYSENYFGENNCECLCESCERLGVGGFAVTSSLPSSTEEVNVDLFSDSRFRKCTSIAGSGASNINSSSLNMASSSNFTSSALSSRSSSRSFSSMPSSSLSRYGYGPRCVHCNERLTTANSPVPMAQMSFEAAVICIRCDRHSRLFLSPWPDRETYYASSTAVAAFAALSSEMELDPSNLLCETESAIATKGGSDVVLPGPLFQEEYRLAPSESIAVFDDEEFLALLGAVRRLPPPQYPTLQRPPRDMFYSMDVNRPVVKRIPKRPAPQFKSEGRQLEFAKVAGTAVISPDKTVDMEMPKIIIGTPSDLTLVADSGNPNPAPSLISGSKANETIHSASIDGSMVDVFVPPVLEVPLDSYSVGKWASKRLDPTLGERVEVEASHIWNPTSLDEITRPVESEIKLNVVAADVKVKEENGKVESTHAMGIPMASGVPGSWKTSKRDEKQRIELAVEEPSLPSHDHSASAKGGILGKTKAGPRANASRPVSTAPGALMNSKRAIPVAGFYDQHLSTKTLLERRRSDSISKEKFDEIAKPESRLTSQKPTSNTVSVTRLPLPITIVMQPKEKADLSLETPSDLDYGKRKAHDPLPVPNAKRGSPSVHPSSNSIAIKSEKEIGVRQKSKKAASPKEIPDLATGQRAALLSLLNQENTLVPPSEN